MKHGIGRTSLEKNLQEIDEVTSDIEFQPIYPKSTQFNVRFEAGDNGINRFVITDKKKHKIIKRGRGLNELKEYLCKKDKETIDIEDAWYVLCSSDDELEPKANGKLASHWYMLPADGGYEMTEDGIKFRDLVLYLSSEERELLNKTNICLYNENSFHKEESRIFCFSGDSLSSLSAFCGRPRTFDTKDDDTPFMACNLLVDELRRHNKVEIAYKTTDFTDTANIYIIDSVGSRAMLETKYSRAKWINNIISRLDESARKEFGHGVTVGNWIVEEKRIIVDVEIEYMSVFNMTFRAKIVHESEGGKKIPRVSLNLYIGKVCMSICRSAKIQRPEQETSIVNDMQSLIKKKEEILLSLNKVFDYEAGSKIDDCINRIKVLVGIKRAKEFGVIEYGTYKVGDFIYLMYFPSTKFELTEDITERVKSTYSELTDAILAAAKTEDRWDF